MTFHCENDVIRLRESVAADVIGEGISIVIPVGTIGTVVLVHGDSKHPLAYEVEFYLQEKDCYALATIEANKI